MEIVINQSIVPMDKMPEVAKIIRNSFPSAKITLRADDIPMVILSMTAGECGKMSAHETTIDHPPAPMIDATPAVMHGLEDRIKRFLKSESKS